MRIQDKLGFIQFNSKAFGQLRQEERLLMLGQCPAIYQDIKLKGGDTLYKRTDPEMEEFSKVLTEYYDNHTKETYVMPGVLRMAVLSAEEYKAPVEEFFEELPKPWKDVVRMRFLCSQKAGSWKEFANLLCEDRSEALGGTDLYTRHIKSLKLLFSSRRPVEQILRLLKSDICCCLKSVYRDEVNLDGLSLLEAITVQGKLNEHILTKVVFIEEQSVNSHYLRENFNELMYKIVTVKLGDGEIAHGTFVGAYDNEGFGLQAAILFDDKGEVKHYPPERLLLEVK